MADEYLVSAAEFAAKAKLESNPKLRTQFDAVAQSYLRLAEQAQRHIVPPSRGAE